MRTFIILLTAVLLLTACDEQQSSESMTYAMNDTALEHAKKHLDAKYICPMHTQIVRDEPGRCPICGMNLVKKEVKPQPQKTALKPEAKKQSGHKPDKYPTVTIRP